MKMRTKNIKKINNLATSLDNFIEELNLTKEQRDLLDAKVAYFELLHEIKQMKDKITKFSVSLEELEVLENLSEERESNIIELQNKITEDESKIIDIGQ
jgi:hypothetical protein